MKIELPPEALQEFVELVAARVVAELRRQETSPPNPYMSVAEAAVYLRCTRQRVDDLLSSGRLTRVKEGRRTLVARADLERHLTG